jgi:hypothetical protein
MSHGLKRAQCLEITVDSQDPQTAGGYRDDSDRVRWLLIVPGVDEPDPRGKLGRQVHHLLALNRRDPIRPRFCVRTHRGVAGLVGGEPTRAGHLLLLVHDLDRGGQLVRIDPDDDLRHALIRPDTQPAEKSLAAQRRGAATERTYGERRTVV